MISYLESTGVFKSELKDSKRGRGSPRRYSFRDLVVLRALNKILGAGISVSKLKDALNDLKTLKKFGVDHAKSDFDDQPVRYLFTDGKKLYFRKDASDLIDLTAKGQLCFSFVVDLTQLHSELQILRFKVLESRRGPKLTSLPR